MTQDNLNMEGLNEAMSNDLRLACEDFIKNKQAIATLKLDSNGKAEKIIIEMKKIGRSSIILSEGGDNWRFDVIHSEDKLSCRKETRQPAEQTEG